MAPKKSNQIVTASAPMQLSFSNDQVDLIKKTIAEGATDSELQLFLYQAKRTGLDPLNRQIYFVKRGSKVTIQTSIDGFRIVAQRSGEYEGQTPVKYGPIIDFEFTLRNYKGEKYKSVKKVPEYAEVGIYRKGFREPLIVQAYFEEYVPNYPNQTMWHKMPRVMISKVAEAQAIRKAFPQDLSGLYTTDEMSQAEEDQGQPIERESKAMITTTQSVKPEEFINDFQQKRIVELGLKLGYTEEGIKDFLAKTYKVEAFEQISRSKAGDTILAMEKKVYERENATKGDTESAEPHPFDTVEDAEVMNEGEDDIEFTKVTCRGPECDKRVEQKDAVNDYFCSKECNDKYVEKNYKSKPKL